MALPAADRMRFNKRWLPLNALRAFEAVGRNLHMHRAADEMCVSHSAISQQIRKLESTLDVSLFTRTGKGLQLTPPGSRLLQEVTIAMERLMRAAEVATLDSSDARLRIACAAGIAANWLIPKIDSFLRHYPTYHVRVDPIEAKPKHLPSNVDLAITYGKPPVRAERLLQLAESSLYPVCSPRFLSRLGAGAIQPRTIAKQTLIHADDGTEWQLWFRNAGAPGLSSSRNLYLTAGYHLILDGIRRGLGIGLIARRFIERDLADGHLIIPIDACIADPEHYYLIRPEEKYRTSTGQQLEQWICNQWAAG
jgi:LysR family transcriptional regulator, glycine cleavage system transcriptional activator